MRRRIITTVALVSLLLVILPTQAQTTSSCADPQYAGSHLVAYTYARLINDAPSNVRRQPSTEAEVVDQILPDQVIYLSNPPTCADGYVWWPVMYPPTREAGDFGQEYESQFQFGYTVEGVMPLIDDHIWLEAVPQPISTIPAQRQVITAGNVAQLQQVAQVQYGRVRGFAWSPDNRYLAFTTEGATWIYDLTLANALPTRLTLDSYAGSDARVVRFQPDNNTLITASRSYSPPDPAIRGNVYLWSLANTSQPLMVYRDILNQSAQNAVISPDGSFVAFAEPDGSIALFDTRSGAVTAVLEGHASVNDLAFTPDGTRLISVGGGIVTDTTLRVWDVAAGVQLSMLDLGLQTGDLALSPDGHYLAATIGIAYVEPDATTDIRLVNLDSLSVETNVTVPTGYITDVAFGADSSLLAVSPLDSDGKVLFYDRSGDGELMRLLLGELVYAISFSPDGTLLAVHSLDTTLFGNGRVTLWAVAEE